MFEHNFGGESFFLRIKVYTWVHSKRNILITGHQISQYNIQIQITDTSTQSYTFHSRKYFNYKKSSIALQENQTTSFYTCWLRVDFGQLLTFLSTIDQSQANHPNPYGSSILVLSVVPRLAHFGHSKNHEDHPTIQP